jgi:hypothetical protein
MPLKLIRTPLCTLGTDVRSTHWRSNKLRKKMRPRYHTTLADNLPFGKAVRIHPDSMELIELHHEQIVRLNQSRSLCLIGRRPARTSTDITCVDLISPKQIRPALHCIRSSLLIWQSDIPEKHTPLYSITDRTVLL